MRCECSKIELGKLCSRLSSGKSILASKVHDSGLYPVYGGNGLRGFTDDFNFDGECAIIGRQGAFCGNVRYFAGKAYMTEHAVVVCANENNNTRFLAYCLSTMNLGRLSGQSAQPGLSVKTLAVQEITIPPLETQKKIAAILSALDEKIAINRAINENLERQAMALYRQMFVETNNDARREYRADECFDISIGKTPPRKEAQWFSMNPTDCIWVSISDMGNCGLYIADSSEYLTHESVKKFNIKVVPDNTVLLSFKLTVGRVAITDGAMATNEAIAHFKTDKPEINEYLYCYLKDFNYQTMGSTSSIATAVNSKIIKTMPFVVPTDTELDTFHSATAPMFETIKTRQRENTRLARLRDTLLPKLMSGEIDVSAVQF
ncbi:MAG TPA: restriction endonuclease subunit S [Clostridiales bacterium]|nr:restriction endonuclease subunit S [Clostridiales bacterium]